MTTSSPFAQPILFGHLLLIASGIFYSFFWILNETNTSFALPFLSLLFFGSLFAGLIGIIQLIYGSLRTVPNSLSNFGVIHIIIIGILFFIMTTFVSAAVFKRVFTSELFFITLWGVAEMSAIYTLNATKVFSKIHSVTSISLASIAIIIAIFCYEMHYIFEGKMRFYNGLVPYGVVVLVMAVIVAFQI